jgi:hypothetical protein
MLELGGAFRAPSEGAFEGESAARRRARTREKLFGL